MNRHDLAHALRAAGAVVGESEFVVVGSAALFGSFQDRFVTPEVKESVEADLVSPNDPTEAKADLLDGSIGELSSFHATHGFYVDGVGPATALLPAGWERRVMPFAPLDANGVVGWCPHPADIAASKAVANRPKDRRFISAVVAARLVSPAELVEAISAIDTDPRRIEVALGLASGFKLSGDQTLQPSHDLAGVGDEMPSFDASIFGFALVDKPLEQPPSG